VKSSATSNWRFAERTDSRSAANSNWRHARHDAATKYQCVASAADLYVLVDLNGRRTLLHRCCCSGARHVLNTASSDNAADMHKLRPADYIDDRDRVRNPHVGGTF
jgi:hypothetical protein